MSNAQHITNNIAVDLDKSRCVWEDGHGDDRIELWAGDGYVWVKTNGDPVADQEGVVQLLAERGVPQRVAEDAAEGSLAGLSHHDGWVLDGDALTDSVAHDQDEIDLAAEEIN